MFPRYYYYLCCVRVNKFRVQNRVRVVLSLFSKACKLHGKSIATTVKLHCFYIIKAMEFARNLYRLWSWWVSNPRPNREILCFLHVYFGLHLSDYNKTRTTNYNLSL